MKRRFVRSPSFPVKTRPTARKPLSSERLETRTLFAADAGWAFGLGGPAIESESAVAVGPDGNVYVTGSFNGTIDLDPGPGLAQFTTHINAQDGFVAKYTQQGTFLWASTFGGVQGPDTGPVGHELSREIEFDALGNVYITGISGSARPQFGGITLENLGHYDLFVAKLSAGTGAFQWAQRIGGTENDLGYDLAVNPAGEVYVAGQFDATLDADPAPGAQHILVSAGESDGFVWKLDTQGNFEWIRQFGGASNDTGHRVELGDDGYVYAMGTFRDTVDFGQPGTPMTLTNPSGTATSNTYLVKLEEATGDTVWARQIGGLNRTSGGRLAADGEGGLFVAGGFEGTLDFGHGEPALVSAGLSDAYVSKWGTDGNLLWAEQVGGAGNDAARAISVSPTGDPLILLSFEQTVDFDPGPATASLASAGLVDGAFLKMASDGAFQSVRHFAGPGSTVAHDVFEDATGNTFVVGFYQDSVALPTGDSLARSGNSNFLVKLAPAAPTKFFVVDGASDKTHEYDAQGNRQDIASLASGNTNPRGAASNVAGNRVWVIDANKKVFVYDNAGVLLGSWTASGLNAPQGITTNGTDLWIVDAQTDKVYKYSGAASRLSGSQSAASSFNLNSQNSNATDLVTDGASFWVVNSAATDKVFKYNLSGTLLGSWTIDSRDSSPTGITLDPSNPGTLWIVDNAADQVFAYAGATTRTSGSQSATIAVNLGQGNTDPQGIADPPPGAWSSTQSTLTNGSRWNDAAFGAALSSRSGIKANESALDAVWAVWS